MTDIGNITNQNGFCITVDSNIASVDTSEKFFRELLSIMRDHPEYKAQVSAVNPNNIECVALPIRLRDLSQLKTEATSDRTNHASNRAEIEARLYAARYFPPGKTENAGFYTQQMPSFIDDIKSKFSDRSGKEKSILVLSQLSFARLTNDMVNLLLKKKPDGTDNIVRQRKQNPETEIVHEDGTTTFSYYTEEEIAEKEKVLRTAENADNFLTLDVQHVPFTIDNILISAASQINVKRNSYNKNLKIPTVDEIFEDDDELSILLREQYMRIKTIANRDLDIISIIESRGASIQHLIHADCRGEEVLPQPVDESKLTIREIYSSLLIYVKYILAMISELITIIHENGNKPSININNLIGIETTSEGDNPLNKISDLLSSKEFSEFFKSESPAFSLPPHFIRYLMISLLKFCTETAGFRAPKIVSAVSKYFGYRLTETNHDNQIVTFFNIENAPVAVVDTPTLILILEGKMEPLISYLYRTSPKYLEDNGTFNRALGIIDRTVTFIQTSNSSKKPPRYDVLNSDFVFDVDSLIETAKHLSGYSNLSDSVSPFSNYKSDILKKNETLREKRIKISEELSQKYGSCSLQYYIPLPSIPYSQSELFWFKQKCAELETKIGEIKELNPTFNWDLLREEYRRLRQLKNDNASSQIDSQKLKLDIEKSGNTLKTLYEVSGIDSSKIDLLSKYEESLIQYSNPEKMEFGFEAFEFKFNKDVDLTMNYIIDNTSIMVGTEVRTCSSILNDTGGDKIIIDYFDPFFRPFATVNTQSFNISISLSDKLGKNGLISKTINMTVTFGSTDDTHMCTKFRTKFFSISNRQLLIQKSKEALNIPDNRLDFSLNEVPSKFIVRWSQSEKQKNAMQGLEKEKTLKFYDKVRGCSEMYPFYDNVAMSIIMNQFTIYSNKFYGSQQEREKRNKETAEKRRIENEKRGNSGNDYDRNGPKISVPKNSGIWVNGDISGVDLIKSQIKIGSFVPNIAEDEIYSEEIKKSDKKPIFTRQRELKKSNATAYDKQVDLIKDQTQEQIVQVFKTRRVRENQTENNGWSKIVYHDKIITVKIRPVNENSDTKKHNNRKGSTTPHRFKGGLRSDDRRTNSNIRGNRHNSRNGTPSNNGFNSGRSQNRESSRGSTPNSYVNHSQNKDSASPNVSKRSVSYAGAKSPIINPEDEFKLFNRSAFNSYQSNTGVTAFYPSVFTSPVVGGTGDVNDQVSLFNTLPVSQTTSSTPNTTDHKEKQDFVTDVDADDW
uniref:Uncharacterized protein n=1 Tax=viral metagenome TaxID=1070528 RepID=A0A6C0BCD0_9ZZZZ